jgi:hypothetical protein
VVSERGGGTRAGLTICRLLQDHGHWQRVVRGDAPGLLALRTFKWKRTYCVQSSQMLDLLITTREVASQLRSDLVG